MLLPSCETFRKVKEIPAISVLFYQTITPNAAEENKVIFSGLTLDEQSGDSLIFVTVGVYREEQLVMGIETNFSGYFSQQIKQLTDTANYTAVVSYVGMETLRIENIRMAQGDSCYLQVGLGPEYGEMMGFPPFMRFPLIEVDNMTSGQTFTSDQIKRSPTKGR